jgi:hypothetical protein
MIEQSSRTFFDLVNDEMMSESGGREKKPRTHPIWNG